MKRIALTTMAAMVVMFAGTAAPLQAETATGALGGGEPRALVTDVTGQTRPAVEAFDELGDGATIRLQGNAELTITFYPTCEDLTIRGGVIAISGDRMTLDKGELVGRIKGDCPGNVRLSAVDVVNAAVVTRSAKGKATISTTPAKIGVVGPGAGKYDKIGVYGTDGTVFEAPLQGNGVTWPAKVAGLQAGKQYMVVLTGPGAQMYAAKVFPEDGAPRVTVFRIK